MCVCKTMCLSILKPEELLTSLINWSAQLSASTSWSSAEAEEINNWTQEYSLASCSVLFKPHTCPGSEMHQSACLSYPNFPTSCWAATGEYKFMSRFIKASGFINSLKKKSPIFFFFFCWDCRWIKWLIPAWGLFFCLALTQTVLFFSFFFFCHFMGVRAFRSPQLPSLTCSFSSVYQTEALQGHGGNLHEGGSWGVNLYFSHLPCATSSESEPSPRKRKNKRLWMT